MDILQSKLNVIEWMTDYTCHFSDSEAVKLVELRHKKGFSACIYTAKTLTSLLTKLDTFLERKLQVIHKNG